jgi:hypothetical protein
MQPSAIMKPRPELHQSAPSANMRAMSNELMTLPAAPILTRSRRPAPISVLCTSSRPSCSGAPMWSANSTGAAPVPPSAPSTTMKSGVMPVSSMALTMPNHSQMWPMHSLKPVGLPPDSSRRRAMNCISSTGVENALCAEARRSPHRHAARGGDLGRHLGARQHAAVAGLGALAELDLDHLDLRVARLLGKALGVEAAVRRCGSRSSPSRSPRSGRRRARGGSG